MLNRPRNLEPNVAGERHYTSKRLQAERPYVHMERILK